MNDSSVDISGNPQPAPRVERAVHRKSAISRRFSRYISLMILLAALSTLAGYQVSRLEFPMARWFRTTSALASARIQPPAFMPASTPSATNADLEAISHLAPQQQAERLLELAVQRPDQSLGLIHKNLDSWRGHLEDTDQLFHLVLAALDSNDPRVRVAAVEIDLVANNLMKSPQSLAKLLHQIHNDPDSRYQDRYEFDGEVLPGSGATSSGCWRRDRFPRRRRGRGDRWSQAPQARDERADRCLPGGRA